MKSTLPNKEELSIRYIMQELDPSEQVMMEKAIAEDENLLIEVEAFRGTFNRCREHLVVHSAPEEVLENVIRSAGAANLKSRRAPVRYLVFRRISYAAAATVMLSAGIGWYAVSSGNDSNVTPNTVNALVAPAEFQPATNTPWIDNRDVLHINSAGIGNMATQPDSVPSRLRPVDEVTGTSRPARQLQLTGSGN